VSGRQKEDLQLPLHLQSDATVEVKRPRFKQCELGGESRFATMGASSKSLLSTSIPVSTDLSVSGTIDRSKGASVSQETDTARFATVGASSKSLLSASIPVSTDLSVSGTKDRSEGASVSQETDTALAPMSLVRYVRIKHSGHPIHVSKVEGGPMCILMYIYVCVYIFIYIYILYFF
jgi:hypothetical protein